MSRKTSKRLSVIRGGCINSRFAGTHAPSDTPLVQEGLVSRFTGGHFRIIIHFAGITVSTLGDNFKGGKDEH